MKFCFLLLNMLAFSCLASAQLQLKVQLKSVVRDVSNEFQTYKGDLKAIYNDDSTYFSTVTIEGSEDNEIEIIGERMIQYHAYIADSATKKQADELVKKWKERIQAAVPDYQQARVDYTVGRRKTTGFRFSKLLKPMCNISIVSSKREIDNYYWVLLSITRQGREPVKTDHRPN